LVVIPGPAKPESSFIDFNDCRSKRFRIEIWNADDPLGDLELWFLGRVFV